MPAIVQRQGTLQRAAALIPAVSSASHRVAGSEPSHVRCTHASQSSGVIGGQCAGGWPREGRGHRLHIP